MTEVQKVAFLAVLVCGGRKYANFKKAFEVLDGIHNLREINLIITGSATGADDLAERWAKANEVPYQGWPARWIKYGNSSGPRRNVLLVNALVNTPGFKICVAFPGGRGTEDCVDRVAYASQHLAAIDILRVDEEEPTP